MAHTHLAILGGGNMGRALIGGLLRRGTRPEHVSVGESNESARAALARDFGIQTTPDNRVAIEAATLLIVAVKPQDLAEVLRPLRPVLQLNRPTVVSVAAGLAVLSAAGAFVSVPLLHPTIKAASAPTVKRLTIFFICNISCPGAAKLRRCQQSFVQPIIPFDHCKPKNGTFGLFGKTRRVNFGRVDAHKSPSGGGNYQKGRSILPFELQHDVL